MIGNFTIVDALMSLRPGAQWSMVNLDYDGINWLDEVQTKPSKQQLEVEVARLIQNWEDTEYQRKRAAEYPPMTDYLDGIVKGDTAQVSAYIAACNAVKTKYPKP